MHVQGPLRPEETEKTRLSPIDTLLVSRASPDIYLLGLYLLDLYLLDLYLSRLAGQGSAGQSIRRDVRIPARRADHSTKETYE